MSNGLTDVLLDYLLLSGADLAYTDSEKRMMVFLSCIEDVANIRSSRKIRSHSKNSGTAQMPHRKEQI